MTALDDLTATIRTQIDTYTQGEVAAAVAAQQATDANSARGTLFGFNVINGGTGYMQPPLTSAHESASQSAARLVGDYGPFPVGKFFYSHPLPATFNPAGEGQVPGKRVMVCVAPGASVATVQSYTASVPADWTVMVTVNEPDGKAQNVAAAKAWLDSIYPATRGTNVEVWDCFMEYSLEHGAWQDSWTTPGLRDGIGFDTYWNTPEDPTVKLGRITTVAQRLGIGRVAIPEFGDRRPGSNGADATVTDLTRAGQQVLIHEAIKRAGIEWACLFSNYGTTGDHRVIPTLDPLTYAAIKPYHTA